MSEILITIGLPGSGKTHYIHNVLSKKGETLITFDDWGRKKWGNYFVPNPEGEFIDDDRYGDLIKEIKNLRGKIIVSGAQFCDHDFLCKSEYYLKSQFPNLKIRRIYFENNLEKSISNIIYRDKDVNGGHFKTTVDGEKWSKWYMGDHFENAPTYKVIIKHSEEFSEKYIIPSTYSPIPIFVTKNYKLSDHDF